MGEPARYSAQGTGEGFWNRAQFREAAGQRSQPGPGHYHGPGQGGRGGRRAARAVAGMAAQQRQRFTLLLALDGGARAASGAP